MEDNDFSDLAFAIQQIKDSEKLGYDSDEWMKMIVNQPKKNDVDWMLADLTSRQLSISEHKAELESLFIYYENQRKLAAEISSKNKRITKRQVLSVLGRWAQAKEKVIKRIEEIEAQKLDYHRIEKEKAIQQKSDFFNIQNPNTPQKPISETSIIKFVWPGASEKVNRFFLEFCTQQRYITIQNNMLKWEISNNILMHILYEFHIEKEISYFEYDEITSIVSKSFLSNKGNKEKPKYWSNYKSRLSQESQIEDKQTRPSIQAENILFDFNTYLEKSNTTILDNT